MIKFSNTFQRGLDKDTTAVALDNQSIRDAINIELLSDEEYAAIVNGRKKVKKATLCDGDNNTFKVLAGVGTYANIFDGSDYKSKRGIVFFTYDDSLGSLIKYYDIETELVTNLIESNGDIDFKNASHVSAFSFVSSGCYFVYFTGPGLPLRRIEIKIDRYLDVKCVDKSIKGSQSYPDTDDLYVRNLYPEAFLTYESQDDDGGLLSGSYVFFFRLYNSETCRFSAVSQTSMPIPVVLSGQKGGRVGQPTRKRISLKLNGSHEGYDQIQLFVIENVSGVKTNQELARALDPIDIPEDGIVYYASSGVGQGVDLNDYLIDDAAIIGFDDWAIANNRLFGISPTINNFFIPESITAEAEVIMYGLGDADEAYKSEDHTVNYKGYMGGEQYPFGVELFDSFGNGIVCPLDLSGAEENQSDSWAFKFPERKGVYSKFNSKGKLQAMGLKISLSGNLPDWVCGFRIVRGERIKNILGKTVHIPTVGVQGVGSQFRWSKYPDFEAAGIPVNRNPEVTENDHDVAIDYICPKTFSHGIARNIVRRRWTEDELFILDNEMYRHYELPEYRIADDNGGPAHEMSRVIFAQVPEFMYSKGGETFNDELLENSYLVRPSEIVLFEYDRRLVIPTLEPTSSIFDTPLDPINTMESVHVFKGDKPVNYVEEIPDNIPSESRNVSYTNAVVAGSPSFELKSKPFRDQSLEEITRYGAMNEMTQSQLKADAVLSKYLTTYENSRENQRGVVIGLDRSIPDLMGYYLQIAESMNLQVNPELFDDSLFEAQFIPRNSSYAGIDVCVNEIWHTDLPQIFTAVGQKGFPHRKGEIRSGAFILNIESNIGDDRYGLIENPNVRWVRTGAISFDKNKQVFDVFGGDTFLTKHTFKVNDTVPKVQYVLLNKNLLGDQNDLPNHNGFAEGFKVSQSNAHVEFIEVILESTVNSAYESLEDVYPAVDDKKIGEYLARRNYEYNPGYSFDNDDKPLISKQETCKDITNDYTVWHSDVNVRGAQSNPFIDVFGFNRYRANNFFNLDGQYGRAIRIVSIGAKDLHVVQERRICYLPVGINEIQTADSEVLAVSSGAVIGTDYYLPYEVGSQHWHTVKLHDGMLFGFDKLRSLVWATGGRGGNFQVISRQRMDSYFDEFSRSDNFVAYIDIDNGKYLLSNGQEIIVWNERAKFWETRKVGDLFDYGVGIDGLSFEVIDGRLYGFGEERQESELTIVSNYGPNLYKVLEGKIEVVADGEIKAIRVRNIDGSQDTGWLNAVKRKNKWYSGLLRSKGKRLKGQGFLISVRTGDKKTSVFGVNSFFNEFK